jgi:glycosyltransferase involved in cell wall biosynthesis
MPRVSVIVPAFNSQRFILKTLESIRAQTMADWDLVVIDDGSSDDTAAIVADWIRTEPRARLVRQENRGEPAARYRGLQESNPAAEFIYYLDSDDVAHPDALDVLLAASDAMPDGTGAHALARMVDPDDRPVSEGQMEYWPLNRRGVVAGRVVDWPVGRPTTFEVMVLLCWITTPGTALIRRKSIMAVGDFSDIFPSDWYLWLRLTARGPIAFIPRVVLDYRRHGTNLSTPAMVDRSREDLPRLVLQRGALSDKQRELVHLGYRLARLDASRYRLRWAGESLRRGAFVDALRNLRRSVLERWMYHTVRLD